jgi:hypothetical protein
MAVYTTIDDPAEYFNTILYTGDIVDGDGSGHTQAITGVGFSPDLVWHKGRSHTCPTPCVDTVRGTSSYNFLKTSESAAEVTANVNGAIKTIDSDGITVEAGTDSSSKSNNAGANGRTYVFWNWLTGTSFSNDQSATSVGTIDSAGSVNTTAGISIIKYAGNNNGTITHIAHGLSGVPEMYMVKSLDSVGNWQTYHHKNTSAPETDNLQLDNPDATADYTFWGDTAPTSTVFTVKDGNDVNESGEEFMCYLFRSIQGYSKVGSFIGNGNTNGAFVYTGFRPAWIMTKNIERSDNWMIFDNKRLGYNVDNNFTFPNLGNTEVDSDQIDILSNGFKCRNTNDAINSSGEVTVYMAFAEAPFVNSNGVPCNAR